MDIGPFYAKETVLYNSDGAVYQSRQLRSLVPYRCTYGYDVLVYVGRGLFLHCRTEQQIIEEEYAIIRKRLKTHKIRAVLRRKAKELSEIIGDEPEAVGHLWVGIENGCVDGTAMDKMPAMAAYAMAHGIFDKSGQSF